MTMILKNRTAADVSFTPKSGVLGKQTLYTARDSDAHPAFRWSVNQKVTEGVSYSRPKAVITIPRYDAVTMAPKKALVLDISGLVPVDCTVTEIENLRELAKSYIDTVEFSELVLNAQA